MIQNQDLVSDRNCVLFEQMTEYFEIIGTYVEIKILA